MTTRKHQGPERLHERVLCPSAAAVSQNCTERRPDPCRKGGWVHDSDHFTHLTPSSESDAKSEAEVKVEKDSFLDQPQPKTKSKQSAAKTTRPKSAVNPNAVSSSYGTRSKSKTK
ncbi:hypothetical protein DFH06DRAFT_1134176 [Mycena polygramma]|nr:hypothetical protein DFH06DRAFT_1134173 [Mycena polygramma]KAJ7652721.1 hypothetical protein DFH06DRAFT_1134176 [Mycena polygramma]